MGGHSLWFLRYQRLGGVVIQLPKLPPSSAPFDEYDNIVSNAEGEIEKHAEASGSSSF